MQSTCQVSLRNVLPPVWRLLNFGWLSSLRSLRSLLVTTYNIFTFLSQVLTGWLGTMTLSLQADTSQAFTPFLYLTLLGRTLEPWTQDGRHHGYNAERRPHYIREGVWWG